MTTAGAGQSPATIPFRPAGDVAPEQAALLLALDNLDVRARDALRLVLRHLDEIHPSPSPPRTGRRGGA